MIILLATMTVFPSGDSAINWIPPLLMRSRASCGTRPVNGVGVGVEVGVAVGRAVAVREAVGVILTVGEGTWVGRGVVVIVGSIWVPGRKLKPAIL